MIIPHGNSLLTRGGRGEKEKIEDLENEQTNSQKYKYKI